MQAIDYSEKALAPDYMAEELNLIRIQLEGSMPQEVIASESWKSLVSLSFRYWKQEVDGVGPFPASQEK